MAPHSSTLAWKIPWMEEPGGLQSMGLWRVGHDWATSLSLFTFMHWRRKWQPTPVFLPGEPQGWRSLVGCCLWGHTVGHTVAKRLSSSSSITHSPQDKIPILYLSFQTSHDFAVLVFFKKSHLLSFLPLHINLLYIHLQYKLQNVKTLVNPLQVFFFFFLQMLLPQMETSTLSSDFFALLPSHYFLLDYASLAVTSTWKSSLQPLPDKIIFSFYLLPQFSPYHNLILSLVL